MKRSMNKNFDSIIINEGEFLKRNNHRAYKRINDIKKASHKRRTSKAIYNGYDWYKNLHQYSKNKIFCSCPLCRPDGVSKKDKIRMTEMNQSEVDFKKDLESTTSLIDAINCSIYGIDPLDGYDDDYYDEYDRYYDEYLSENYDPIGTVYDDCEDRIWDGFYFDEIYDDDWEDFYDMVV